MALDTGVSECIEGEMNQEQEGKLSEKQIFLNNMLNGGIEITSELEFNKISEILLKENIHDLSSVSFLDISKTGKPFAMKRMNTDENTLTIFSLYSTFNLNENGPFSKGGTIENGGVFELELSRDINYLKSNSNQFQILMNQYNNAQGEVVQDSKQKLCSLAAESDLDLTKQSENQNNGDILSGEVQSNDQSKNETIDSENNSEAQVNEITINSTVAEIKAGKETQDKNKAETPIEIDAVKKEAYTIKQGDSIWSIIKAKYSNNDTVAILRYLNSYPETIGFPKGSNISKIKIGQKLEIPSNLSKLANQEVNKTIDKAERKEQYTVKYGDTLYSIFMNRYEDVTGYGSFLNKFNRLQKNPAFNIKSVNQTIKGGDIINLP